MKVILAHDSFIQYGGAERVFEGMQELFSNEPIYTLVLNDKFKQQFTKWDFVTSPLQWLYNWYPHFQHLFPFIPAALAFFKTEKADILLSSSSSYIKGLTKPAGGYHVNYCHTPTRFLWIDPQHAYKEIPKGLHWLAKIYMAWLKSWDLTKACQVDYFIANSIEVQKRIKKYYNRNSVVIYPFIDEKFWFPTKPKQDYFLIAGRLQYSKGLDLVINVFNDLGLTLHVVGSGRYEEHLKSIARENIKFLGRINDERLRDEYSGALGFIYPQVEDFGIMPLEAASCGTATIGIAEGGSLETIIPEVTGELMQKYDQQTLKGIITSWNQPKYSLENLVAHSKKFTKEKFQKQLMKFINNLPHEDRH